MSDGAEDTSALDPADAAVMAELRTEFAKRLKDDLAEVERELAAIRSGGAEAGYQRIEALMHRDAGAAAVFGFDEAGTHARAVEELVQGLGSDLSLAAQDQIAEALLPLRRMVDEADA